MGIVLRRPKSRLLQSIAKRGKSSWKQMSSSLALLLFCLQSAGAQQILQTLEPGMGYARFKQWAIENKMVFENFTKDSLIARDTGLRTWESIRIQVRFCGGDDYSGKASNIIIQQLFKPEIDVVATAQRELR